MVDQLEPEGVGAGPDAALRDLVDARDRQVARGRDQPGEPAIDVVDAGLQDQFRIGGQAAHEVGVAGIGRRLDRIGRDAQPVQRTIEGRDDREHADRAGDGRRRGEHFGRCGRHPIPARRRDRPHRSDHRQPLIARLGQCLADAFRCRHRPAGRIDPYHQRLNIGIDQGLVDQASNGVAAGTARAGLAVDDVAGDIDDADRRSAPAPLGRRVVSGERNSVECTGLLVVAFADDGGDGTSEGDTGADGVDQMGVEGLAREIAVRSGNPGGQVGKISRDIDSGTGSADVVDIGLPHAVDERLLRCLGFGRGVAARERLDERLVLADAEDVDVDIELIERLLEIQISATGAVEQDAAYRTEPRLRRLRRKVITRIGVGRGIGVDRFAAFLEGLERGPDRLQIGLAGTEKRVELKHDQLDPAIAARRIDCANDSADFNLAAVVRCAGECPKRRALTRLIDHRAIEIEHQRRSVGHRSGPARMQRRPQSDEEDQQQQQHDGILDADQEAPGATDEFHRIVALARNTLRYSGRVRPHNGRDAKTSWLRWLTVRMPFAI